MHKEHNIQNAGNMDDFTEDMQSQIVESTKTQLLEQGQKFYCPNCSTMENFISSSEQGTCTNCNTKFVSLDNLG